jgi:putative ABC transport system permease protein
MGFGVGNFKMAVANLRQSPWRSTFTMLGIVIGITSVVTTVSLGEGLKHQISGQINQLGKNVISVRSGSLVNRNNSGGVSSVNILAFLSTSTLTNQDVATLTSLPQTQAVVPIDFVTSSAKSDAASSNNLFVVATSDQLPDVLRTKVEFGSFFDQSSDQNAAVIGANVAHQLFGELNPVGQTVHIGGSDFIVRGVLATTPGGLLSLAETDFNSAIFIPLQSTRDITGNHSNILQILVKAKSKNSDALVAAAHKALLKNHDGQNDFTVLTQNELLGVAGSTVNTLTSFISTIAAVSLLVGGISIMDIMWVSISERTREIGVRKAIGATQRQILNQFLMEGVVLSLAGGVVGVIVSLFINLILKLYSSLHPAITPYVMAVAVLVSIIVGITFSVAPALKAARKNPIDALRGE